MAPTFLSGKDIDVLLDEKDLSKFLNDFTVSASLDPLEVTSFDDGGDRAYIKGLRDATVSLDGMYSATTDSTGSVDEWAVFLEDTFTGSSNVVVTITPQPQTTGGRAFLAESKVTTFDISSPVDGTVDTSLDMQVTGGYRGGVMLRPLSQATTDDATSAYETPGTTEEGGTTGGGVGHLHVTAISASTAVVVIQHSTSGSTWADLITFEDVNDATFERSTVSGTVKEQLRSSITVSSGSVTAAVAFARHNSRT